MLLIENKIGAGFQPRQAERYRERGESYMETGRCHSYRTILVAPSTYLGESPDSRRGFDAVVTYEEIGEWIDLDVGAGRTLYKRALLGAAIQKATLGYQPDEDAPVTAFWRSYWELAKDIAPDLVMNEPGPKPGGSSFVYFRSHQLPAGVRIVHKMVYGNLDLQFGGMAGRLGELRANYQQHLIEGMTITTAAKSGVVRQKVPPVDPSRAFELQEEEVRTCLSATAALLAWYEGVS